MKISTVFRCLTVFVLGALVLGAGLPAYAEDLVPPIEPGPDTVLPDYIGSPAKAHPTANSGTPQDPFLAPNGLAHSHSDAWMSDVTDFAGPLGRNPVTQSTNLPGTHLNSWLVPTGSFAFDSHNRLVLNTYGVNEASVILVDPNTLEVLATYSLEVRVGPPFGEGDQKMLPSVFSIYGYLDNLDRVHIVTGEKRIVTISIVESPSGPKFEEVPEESYDLSALVGTGRVSGVMMDFQGRYWINMGNAPTIYLLDPATAKPPYTDLPRIDLGEGEFTRNGLALTKEGAAYIVTTQKMYRVDAGTDGQLHKVWEVPYDTIGKVRPGQYELGSGTTPTVLGEGKYVAITDNDVQMNVVVYRTEAKLDPQEDRVVCKMPVFDFPGGGAGGLSNSLSGMHNSILVQNTYDYLFDFDYENPHLVKPSMPGFERIDINPNGDGCTKVWGNQEVTSTMVPKLSTRTGLIYTQDRKWDAENQVFAYYWAALDFRTGEVVWEKLAGTGDKFDNWWAPLGIGQNGVLYGTVYGGLTMLKDTP